MFVILRKRTQIDTMRYNYTLLLRSLFIAFFMSYIIVNAQKPQPVHPLEVRLEADEARDTYIDGNKKIDQATGTPLAIYAINKPTEGSNPLIRASNYLQENYRTFGLQYPDLSDLRHHATRSSDAGDVVRFRQYIGDYPLLESEVTVNIAPNNHVQMVQSSYYGDAKLLSEEVVVDQRNAEQIAMSYINPTRLMQTESSHLMVYHNSQMTRLAHEVMIIASNPQGEWHVYVDAQTGEIFKAQNELHYYCKHHHSSTCSHPPATFKYDFPGLAEALVPVDGTGMVFDPDPLSSNQVAYGGNYVDANDATNTQLDAARVSVTLRDIDLTNGTYMLRGPWADIRDHDTPTTGLFTQTSSIFNFNRQQQAFEAVNCYYHLDDMMRYINITLNCPAVPFQYTGGVRFDPHGAGGADNSFYSGGAGTLTFGEGGVDDGEDSDVIHHELGHFVHDMLTAGGLSQVNGLSEGFGDYLAQSYNRSLNNWAITDPAYHWVFNWDGHNPFFGGRDTNNSSTYPSGLVGQVHADGSIWSTVSMKIYDEIGRQATDKAIFEGIAMTNGSSNQNDAANSVYQAAINLLYTNAQLVSIHSEFTTCGYTLPALPTAPTAAISANATEICRDNVSTIDFTDASISVPAATSWLWTFEGGTPATSTLQNPTVTYNADGDFDVSLSVTNSLGNSTIAMTDYISVLSGANCPSCTTYTNSTIMSIGPNQGTITSSIINVTNGGSIDDINITNITGTHTFLGDLTFTLVSPSNTSVILTPDICGNNNDFDVGFDDAAASASLPCPYTDGMLYIPFEALSLFNGEEALGNWTLEIEDDANQDGGDLETWSLEVCVASTSTCVADLAVPMPSTGTYNASNILTSDGVVNTPDNATFQAANCVELLPGFEVIIGAEFLGEIEVCPQ